MAPATLFHNQSLHFQVKAITAIAHPPKARDPHRRGDSLLCEVAYTCQRLWLPVRYLGEMPLARGTRHHLFEVYNDHADVEVPPTTSRVHVEETITNHDNDTMFRITLISDPSDDPSDTTRYFVEYDEVAKVLLTIGALAHNTADQPVTWDMIAAELAQHRPWWREETTVCVEPWGYEETIDEVGYAGPANGWWDLTRGGGRS